MNHFTKQWLTSSCAPDSISNLRSSHKGHLDIVTNEDKTKRVFVLSNDKGVVSIGIDYNSLLIPQPLSFMDGVRKVAMLLSLNRLSVPI